MTNKKTTLSWKNYLELCKPKVVALLVFTANVGMLLAVPGMPPIALFIYATLGIGLASASAAAINHFIDQKADAEMARTENRPLPQGDLNSVNVLVFAGVLGIIAMLILFFFSQCLNCGTHLPVVNWLCCYLYCFFKTYDTTKYRDRWRSRCSTARFRLVCNDW